MNELQDWFAYSSFRPGQEEMLQRAFDTARTGGVLLIDAPTGSGKSSVVSALLAGRKDRQIIVAVRTISQLTTYIRELELIRKKQPGLKFSYLVGKSSMCPLGGSGDTYRKCEAVKGFSTALIRERADRGSLDPSKDKVILDQIRKNDPDHPIICPFFIRSRMAIQNEKAGGLRLVPSDACKRLSTQVIERCIKPDTLRESCGGLCPYEVMAQASLQADVLICNYHHIMDEQIRGQLYLNLQREPSEILLLIDEAHNCGDVMQDIMSVSLDHRALEQADHDISSIKKDVKDLEAIRRLIPGIKKFLDGLRRSTETEDWFDPQLFSRMILRESLYGTMEEVVDDFMDLAENIRETNSKKGDFRTTGIERLSSFLYRLHNSGTNPAYLTLFRKDNENIYLEVRNIDPSPALSTLAREHFCSIYISGTLTPLSSYQQLYFRALPVDYPVTSFSLPNHFPKKNRMVLTTADITSAYSQRQSDENMKRMVSYILTFCTIPGNLGVWFPSYQMLESVTREVEMHLHDREVFIEPRDSSEAGSLLIRFMSLPGKGKKGILFAVCGGKFSEGLDYRGEMLTGAMVIGLPLAPWNQVRQMIMHYYTRQYGEEGKFIAYTLPALNKVLQALGRVLRTPEDRGVLIIGDNRFLDPSIKERLPGWMQEEIQEVSVHTFPSLLKGWK
ncbi:ATP-dependent DNA helicase [Methanospirillum hungatei]|mgnify:FL=1|uniref:ATP-dependent DNA helicase n=1 Tax=Methanospirillum hungatei TaxID=2203 RepID=UPI001B70E2BA|nr:ATP-dependent DNA helicase [Methanospirillum hungatei]MBP9007641.1 ATP-dependent DNA helicase [Methanospirillum sp.]HOW04773.1 ATP-dependent DNA helicase [Methanospirillum hungatei]